jgi:anti-anti-sigma factor
VNVVVRAPSSPAEPHVLSISGELDVVSLPSVLERVPELVAGAVAVVVDLGEVSFLDSSGVRFLHRLAHTCDQAGTGVRVVAPPQSRARRVLDIVGMTLLVDDDLDTARSHLQDPPGA